MKERLGERRRPPARRNRRGRALQDVRSRPVTFPDRAVLFLESFVFIYFLAPAVALLLSRADVPKGKGGIACTSFYSTLDYSPRFKHSKLIQGLVRVT